jgi:hypothetical protein
MLRYFTGKTHAPKTPRQQKEALLNAIFKIQSTTYEELLATIQEYPAEVIYGCQDTMGNSLLHLILYINHIFVDRSSSVKEKNEMVAAGVSALPKVHLWKRLRGGIEANVQQDEKTREDGTTTTFLKLVRFLVNYTDIDDTQVTQNSLVRQKSAGGSLPLHTACRFCSEQQLDVVQCLIEAFPFAAQCPDFWGNLPLHEACDIAVVPLEVIIVLIKHHPESTRISNSDGDLPLHLAASSKATAHMAATIIPPDDIDEKRDENCNDKKYGGVPVEHAATDNFYDFHQDRMIRERRQLEIVQYLVVYWPEAVNCTNRKGQTALDQANESSSNLLVIDFLQSLTVQSSCKRSNNVHVVKNNENGAYHTSNPFDNDNGIDDEESTKNSDPVFFERNNLVPELLVQSTMDNNFEGSEADCTNECEWEIEDAFVSSHFETTPYHDTPLSVPQETNVVLQDPDNSHHDSIGSDSDNMLAVELVETFQVVVEESRYEHNSHFLEYSKTNKIVHGILDGANEAYNALPFTPNNDCFEHSMMFQIG